MIEVDSGFYVVRLNNFKPTVVKKEEAKIEPMSMYAL